MLLNKRFEFKNKPHLALNNDQIKSIKEFENEIKNLSNSHYENLPCLICNKNNFEIISKTDRYGFYYPTGICVNCGNLQQTEYLNDEMLKLFYSKYYNKIYFNYNNIEERFNSQYKLAINKFQFINNHLQKLKIIKEDFKILEIGCGPGGILFFFKEKGFNVTGIDFDDKHLEYGKNKDLNLFNKSKINLNEKFDLIIISHVLEHMKNPDIEIKKIKENLAKKNTLMYIEVPSIHSINSMYDSDILKYLHIAHCYHFTKSSFINFCKLNDMKILDMNYKIQAIVSFKKEDSEIVFNFENTKNEILKIERSFSYFGKLLIIKRILRRFVGKVLNLLGIKSYFLDLFR